MLRTFLLLTCTNAVLVQEETERKERKGSGSARVDECVGITLGAYVVYILILIRGTNNNPSSWRLSGLSARLHAMMVVRHGQRDEVVVQAWGRNRPLHEESNEMRHSPRVALSPVRKPFLGRLVFLSASPDVPV
jgi:hypothetical protein